MKQVKVLFFVMIFFLSSFSHVARAQNHDTGICVTSSFNLAFVCISLGLVSYSTWAIHGMHQVIVPSEPTSDLNACAQSIVGNRYLDPNAANCLRQIMRGNGTELYLYATYPKEGDIDCVEGHALYGGRSPVVVSNEESSECDFSFNGTFLGYSEELTGFVYEGGDQILVTQNQDVWVKVDAN